MRVSVPRAKRAWLGLILLVGGAPPAAAQTGSYDWSSATTLYGGIERAFVQLTGTAPLKVNCLRIDTLAPGVGFHTTPRASPWVPGVAETVRQTTSAFISTSQTTAAKVVAAVNGDLFDIGLAPVTTLEGFNVSGGVLVSPGAPPGGPSHATFAITRSNAAAVGTTDDTTPVGDTWNAVTGIYQCLLNGAPRLSGTDPQPRTGLGVSNDTRYVYLMTIDGRSSSSIGATNRQVGEWLAYFGAWNGVYVDGGGSTTMAWWNPAAPGTNKAQVLNTPSDGSERSVGNNIGVFFTAPSFTAGDYYWAGNGVRGGGGTWDAATANWRSGAVYGAAVPFAGGASAVGATAIFTGAGGQVVPAAGTTAERIWFQNSGFQLGAATAVSDVSLAGAAEVRLDAGVSATIRARLTAGDLVVRGPGTPGDARLNLWPLAGANAISGTLRLVDRVRVEFGFAASAGTAAVGVEDGSSLDLRGYGVTYANPISLAGAGTSGTGWALRFASGDTLAGDVRLAGATAIRLGDAGAVAASISGAITGTGGLTYTGVGASSISLTGRSTYSGPTTLALGAGAARIGVASEGAVGGIAAGAFGTGLVTLAGGRISGFDAATPRTILNPLGITGTAALGDTFFTAPLTFAAPVTLSGSRTVAVDSSVVFAGGVGQSGTGASLAKAGGGTLVLDRSNPFTGLLTVNEGVARLAVGAALSAGRLAAAPGGAVALSPYLQASVAGLNPNAGGVVDVGSGLLTVQDGLTTSELLTALLQGRANGTWTGTTGITSSQAAADLSQSVLRTVGWLDNGDGSYTVAYAAPGDTNLDWQIDILDQANFFASGKYDTGYPATWLEGDFNYDGIVDIIDAADFLYTNLFDTGIYNPPSQGLMQFVDQGHVPTGVVFGDSLATTGAIASVPEPSGVVMMAVAIGLVAVTGLRRRRGPARPAKRSNET